MSLGILVSGTGVDEMQCCSVLSADGKSKTRLAGSEVLWANGA